MREICKSGSEGGARQINVSFLPLSNLRGSASVFHGRDDRAPLFRTAARFLPRILLVGLIRVHSFYSWFKTQRTKNTVCMEDGVEGREKWKRTGLVFFNHNRVRGQAREPKAWEG
jgi:hypothetical protein